jgi:hypothetical protein
MDNIIGLKHDIPTHNPPAGSLNAWLRAQGIDPNDGYTTQLNATWLQQMMAAGNTFKMVSAVDDLIRHLKQARRNTTAWEVLILLKAGYRITDGADGLVFLAPNQRPVIAGELQQIIDDGETMLGTNDSMQWHEFWDAPTTNYRAYVLGIYDQYDHATRMDEHGRA